MRRWASSWAWAARRRCACDRAHLLTTVAENLDLAPDYYARATLTYKLRVGEKLHGILVEGEGS